MAATFQPSNAFVYVKSYVKQMPLQNVGPALLDEISKIMWMHAPWRWTLGALPATNLTSNTQDFTITTPSDFLMLYDGWISDGANVFRRIIPTAALPTDVKVVGNPSMIAHVSGNDYRIYPKTGTLPSAPAQQFILRYKKQAPVITNETQFTSGFLGMDDEWFWVFQAGVLWKAYQWADDSRAGSVSISDKGHQYSGQMGVFFDGLRQMTEKEKLPVLDPYTASNPKDT